jgi:hypothetical protein
MLLHRYCFLLFLAGLCPCPSQAQSLRSKKSKSVGRSGKGGSKGSSSSGKGGPKGGSSSVKGGGGVVIVGDSSGNGNGEPSLGAPDSPECGTTPPPSLTGGCDLACDFYKLAEKGAQAVLGKIPVVGSFFSTLLGVLWPSGTNEANVVLKETIQYIDNMIAAVITVNILDDIKAEYLTLVSTVQSMDTKIKNNDKSGNRLAYLQNSVFYSCTQLNEEISANALPPIEQFQNLTVNPIAVLASIGNIGQICLAMRTAEIYHFNSTIGGPPRSAADVNTSKANLDSWAQSYIDWAQTATKNALTWRMFQIESASSGCNGGNGKEG